MMSKEDVYHVEVDGLGLPLLQVGVDGGVVAVAVARRSLQALDPDLLLQGLDALPSKKNETVKLDSYNIKTDVGGASGRARAF